MSLKAKLEAVIYAAEEPVTVAQLMAVLGPEVQAELDAAAAQQGQLALLQGEVSAMAAEAEAGDEDALNAETLGLPDPVAAASLATADAATADVQATPDPAEARQRDRRAREHLRSVLEELVADYATGDRGLEVREIAGGYRFATKPESHDAVRGFVRSLKPPLKLSLQALETLAVVAYKQPVTAPEVSEVRGVDSAGALGSLVSRKLVTPAGRKQVIGRPILYRTTREFLLRFGLKDIGELPSIEEFERLVADVSDTLPEGETMPEQTVVPVGVAATEEPMTPAEVAAETDPETSPELDAGRATHLPQADGDPNGSVPSAEERSAEHLTPGSDAPGEFEGDASVPPAGNALVDGRISGVPPSYDRLGDEATDSPALDAATQRDEEASTGGKEA